MDGSAAENLVVELGGVRYDLKDETERGAFYKVFDTLSGEEQKPYVRHIFESLDRVTKERGHYGGMPFFRSQEDGKDPKVYGRSRHPDIIRLLAGNEYDRRKRGPKTAEIDGETFDVRAVYECDRYRERHMPRNDLAILWKDGRAKRGWQHRRSEIDERILLLIQTISHAQHDVVASAETVAMEKLRELIGEAQFESYRMCGAFVTEAQSGMYYILRRCRPTIAFRLVDGMLNPICSLCSHPMGYYAESFCGVLVPTDEVMAHYLMIKSDEHSFWKRSTQHNLADPRSGL